MIILDTDHISLLERKDSLEAYRLMKRLHELTSDEISTTIVTFEEQMRGWLAYSSKARSIEQQIIAYQFLSDFVNNYRTMKLIKFEAKAAAQFQRLKSLKIRIGTMDLKIASIALANNALLLTRNLSDFLQVPNLKAEDWTREEAIT